MNRKQTELVDVDSFVVTKEVATLIMDRKLEDKLIGGVIRALAFPDEFEPPKEAELFWNVLKVGWEQCKKQRGIKRAQAAKRMKNMRERNEETLRDVTESDAPLRGVTLCSPCYGNGNGNGNGNGISPIAPQGGQDGISTTAGKTAPGTRGTVTPGHESGAAGAGRGADGGTPPRTKTLAEGDTGDGDAKKTARGWDARNSVVFATLWARHPVKQGEAAAEREFLRALKRGAAPEEILAAQARMLGPGGWNAGYEPTISKWLRKDGWKDQPRETQKKDAPADRTIEHDCNVEL